MGDMVLQAPLLHLLHRRYGRPSDILSFGGWSRQLYAGCEDVGATRELRLRHAPYWLSPQRWQVVRALQRHDGPVYVSENIPAHAARIRDLLARAGIGADRSLFLTDCPRIADDHWVDRLLAFGCLTPKAWSVADYPWHDADLQRAPRLHPSAEDRADCAAWLAAKGLAGAPLVLLQPGNKRTSRRIASRQHDSKAWPLENWVALIDAMRATHPGMRFVLCGSPMEHALLDQIRARATQGDVVVATRDLPVRRLLALAEIARCMIGVDTGPLHVAAAVGCPLVVLYGAELPALWDRRSPTGAPVINLGGPPRTAVAEIEVGEVVEAWRRIVADPLAPSGK
jgi:heptosyltransferase-2/heptosyltransferase-3